MKSAKIPESFDLTGKTAIVTGAASGIGRAVALDLGVFTSIQLTSSIYDYARYHWQQI